MTTYRNRTATMSWDELQKKGQFPEEVREEIFHLNDKELAELDPRFVTDKDLQRRIITEAIINPWYTLSRLIRIPSYGSKNGISLRWNEEIVSFFLAGMDAEFVYLEAPRQGGGTCLSHCRITMELLQGLHTQVDIRHATDAHGKMALLAVIKMIDLLPGYVQEYLNLLVLAADGKGAVGYQWPHDEAALDILMKSAVGIAGTTAKYFFRSDLVQDRDELPKEMDIWLDQPYYFSGEVKSRGGEGSHKLIISERFCTYTTSENARDMERELRWSILPELTSVTYHNITRMDGKSIIIQLSTLNDIRPMAYVNF